MKPGTDDIAGRLRAGRPVADCDFDAWLPETLERISLRYWTPVGVALRVSRWLSDHGASEVLDIGAGAGKFCVVGALGSSLRFTGLEQRVHLVDSARELASRFGVSDRVEFVHGTLDALDVTRFDALYFYNPFGENMAPAGDHLDHTVEVSRTRFNRDVATTELLLGAMGVGSHVVTYNAFGGRVPDSYDLVQCRVAGINLLRLWRKAREASTGGYWLELDEATLLRRPGQFEPKVYSTRGGVRSGQGS